MPDLAEVDRGLELEAAAVQQRLREHSHELIEEARQIEAFRSALASRAASAAPPAIREGIGVPVRALPPTPRDGSRAGGSLGHACHPACMHAATPSAEGGTTPAAVGGRDAAASTYTLRSLAEGLENEETWWERYRRDVLKGAAGVAEVEG